MAANTLWVVQGHDHPWLESSVLCAQDASWVAGQPPPAGPLAAKTRYRQTDAPCLLSSPCISQLRLDFTEPQWSVTPGQSAVLYDGQLCLGGAVITDAQQQTAQT